MFKDKNQKCPYCDQMLSYNNMVQHIKYKHSKKQFQQLVKQDTANQKTKRKVESILKEQWGKCAICAREMKAKSYPKHFMKCHTKQEVDKPLTKMQRVNLKLYPDGKREKSNDVYDHFKIVSGGGFGVAKVKGKS